MKDHEVARLHNELRDIAIEFHGHQCLRELMVKAIKPMVEENQELRSRLYGDNA